MKERIAGFAIRSGCLISVLALLAGIVLYPRAKWLFWFVAIGIGIFVLVVRTAKDPTPDELADGIEALVDGRSGNWDVDDYEHLRPRNPNLREMWQETLAIGGLPEEWWTRDENTKRQLRDVARKLRKMSSGQSSRS